MALQPHPMTSVMQLSITAAGLCVAAAAIAFTVTSMSQERNARLVEIGIGVLRTDPAKETQVAAARKWALDLIDANAGGVRFSPEARAELLMNPWNAGYTEYSYPDAGYTEYSYPGRRATRPPSQGQVSPPQSK